MSKNKIYSLAICSITLLVLIVSATYAYFGTNTNINNKVQITATTPSSVPTFTATPSNTLALTGEMGVAASNTTPISIATENITVTLTMANNPSGYSCTYDLIYVWDSDEIYTGSDRTNGIFYEGYDFELSLSAQSSLGNSVPETNIDKLPTINGDTAWLTNSKGKKYTYIKKNITITNNTAYTKLVDNWQFTLRLYSIPISQKELYDVNYKAHIEVTNVVC